MAVPPPVEAILDTLEDPAVLLDGRGRVAAANPAARARFGAWMVGRSHVAALRQPALAAPLQAARAHGRAGQARLVHVEGEVETHFRVRVRPLDDGTLGGADDGGSPPVLLTFRDEGTARADAASRRDFVANVSHELRTPLTAAMGFLETVLGAARSDDAARERFLRLLAVELARMERLVSGLLELSRVQAQARRAPGDRVDLAAVAAAAAARLAATASEAGVRVELDGPEAAVVGDADQLLQVVTNLLENAIAYGARPGVARVSWVHVAREPALRGPAWMLTAADDGPGVAAEHVARLTERFYRVDGARDRASGGTGLGLAIVKHIVGRHRGRLRIDGGRGRGLSVHVTLPAWVEP